MSIAKQQLMGRILALVQAVEIDPKKMGVLSTGEQIAVAFVLNRTEHFKVMGYNSILQAADRLGPEWLAAAASVQRGL